MDHVVVPATIASMTPALRRTLHVAGSSVALIGIGFVFARIHGYLSSQDIPDITAGTWSALISLTLVCGAANVLLALAWQRLLSKAGITPRLRWSIKAYGISQLGKYVPGNVFHLASRQALGMSAGYPAAALAKSGLWELSLISAAGASYAFMALPLLIPGLPPLAAAGIFLGTQWLSARALSRTIGADASRALLLYTFYLAVTAMVFIAVLEMTAQGDGLGPQPWLPIAGAYVISWVVGLLTPGAPAGVGVRELSLMVLLKGLIMEADLLMAVVMIRIVSVVGDLLFFCSAQLIRTHGTIAKVE